MEEYLTENGKSKKKKKAINKGKIILNNANDLIKIPINELLSIDVNTFNGILYKKIYEEALRQEEQKINNNSEKKNGSSNKKFDKNAKNQLVRQNSFNSRKNIFSINEKKEELSSEEEEEIKYTKIKRNNTKTTFLSQSEKRIKHHFNKTYNSNFYNNSSIKKRLNFETNNTLNKNKDEQLNINKERYNTNYSRNLNYTDRYFNKNNKTENNINNISQEINYNNSISDNVNNNNNNSFNDDQLTRRFYSGTINYKNNLKLSYNIKRINFEVNYNSQFGEEVGILGSIFPLGNWEHSRVIRLKWNNGHIWKGGIYVNNDSFKYFEFKFLILQENKIKKWEPGENNIFNYNILLNLIKNKRYGFYDKFNYEYNIYNDELTLACKWNY